MESLVLLDALDSELLLLLDDGDALAEQLAVGGGPQVGGAGGSLAAGVDLAGVADTSLEDLLAHADATELVLSTDVLDGGERALECLSQDAGPSTPDSELDALLRLPPCQDDAAPSTSPASGADASSDGASSGRSEPKTAPPRRRRQKDELDYLRAKAAELETELQRIKTREGMGEPAHVGAIGAPSGGLQSSLGVAPAGPPKKKMLWERVARSQLEGRRRVQHENERLKQMVQGQLEVIQGLEKVLQKRAAMEGTEQWLEDRKRIRVVHDSDAAIFEALKMDLGVRYAQTAAVFDGNAYAAQKLDGDHVQVKADGADGMFLEFLASKVVPFDLAETSRVLWNCFTRGQMEVTDGYYSMVDHTDDTLSANIVMSVHQNNHDVMRAAKFVLRRYLEEHRCVLVWACQAETEGTLTKVNGVQMFDFGWTLVEPAPKRASLDGPGDHELSSTIIQSCARVKIKLPAALEHTQEDVVFLTDLVTGSYMRNLVGIHQTVEDMLVEEAIKRAC